MSEKQEELYSGTSFPSSSMSSVDNSYHLQKTVEGFDYEFVPKPDSMYECVICLLVLREPQQTKCGHRFCKACITKWLRESNKSCPVDNEKIVESDLFADNFAKREIQNFNVKCPNNNHGCDEVVMLKFIQRHVDDCPLGLIPCPNKCPNILLRRDIDTHLSSVCCNREILCEHCGESIIFNRLQKHHYRCQEFQVKCKFCGLEMARKKIQHHENNDCEKAVVNCMFQPLGCEEKMQKNLSKEHMNTATSEHLELLCGKVIQISRCLSIPPGRHVFMTGESDTASSMHATQVSEDMLAYISPFLQQLNRTAHQTALKSQDENALKQSSNIEEALLSYTSKPSNNEDMYGMTNLQSCKSTIYENDFKSLRQQNNLQDESLARHTQELTEMQEKYRNMERMNRELKLKMRSLENTVAEMDGRSCNGIYIWKIKEYYKLKREAQQGDTTAIHSPPFYSSYYGYKLCVRVNLNGVDNAKGVCLSVFVHFLQGEYDDILEWPFNGRIILSVLDQNSICEYRRHIVETLMAKPTLAAFQKPTTPRNHKGFGYMEFVPLAALDNGHFIKNDTLIIKAHVIPNG
ncbi:hypothetical protein SNE40_003519 [Patella caerulea]|uniref:RING-type E3 ubiquitin transferase n=1 Tax=Patella caerulea TaxID=87958 RepID=A0AAN8KGL7_PATCE